VTDDGSKFKVLFDLVQGAELLHSLIHFHVCLLVDAHPLLSFIILLQSEALILLSRYFLLEQFKFMPQV
jgi:hypothetical protein